MATELAKAYVQIIPSAEGIKGKITQALGGEASSAGDSAGASLGGNMVGKIKGIIAAAGIGKVVSMALSEGSDLQQSLGGVETLFKNSSQTVIANAQNAYKTAGLSANDYMETATGFAASLLQSLGGDTQKASTLTDMAITDMSDNANKMGTDMGSIQYAYQGFAKQNYTMLDNLKLGYGGTKTEMQRLLTDAQKISGVKYDMNNLSDVYSAIHVIQGQLDITGTTAKEASTTFSGSMSSMKSAFQNLLGTMTTGGDIGPALQAVNDTVFTFVTGNLVPMLGDLIMQLPTMLSGFLSMAIQGLNMVSNNADAIVKNGVDFVTQLIVGIGSAIPYLLEAAGNIVVALGSAIINTDWVSVGRNIITQLQGNMDIAAGEILGSDGNIVQSVLNSITANLPNVLNEGITIITNLANGILQNLPELITTAGEMINTFLIFLMDNMPTIMEGGAQLLLNLISGIIQNLPNIILAIAQVIATLLYTIGTHLPEILKEGILIIGQLIAGLITSIPKIILAIPQIIGAITNEFGKFDWKKIGDGIIQGIIDGLKAGIGAVVDAAKGVAQAALNAAKDLLGIHSPSRVMRLEVGRQISAGIALGITDRTSMVSDAMNQIAGETTGALNTNLNLGMSAGMSASGGYAAAAGYNQIINITSPEELSPYEVARQTRLATRNMVLSIMGA